MTDLTNNATRIIAAFGAALFSLTLIVGTFATPHAATFAGVLA
jgi:hypothetical protein